MSGFQNGDKVVLEPRRCADAFDFALRGRRATVVGVDKDMEGRVFIAVTVDDDPGSDLGESGKPGHRFFFRPDELRPA